MDLLTKEVLQVVLDRSLEGEQHKKPAGKDTPVAGGTTQPAATLWKSHDFDTRISGIALGDVDGDANNEIVMAGKNALYVYRLTADKQFQKIGEIEEDSYGSILGVDAGDINQNGTAEIFVTRLLSNAKRLSSYVLEWDGHGFKKTATGANWFYRVIPGPGNTKKIDSSGAGKKQYQGCFR